MNDLAIAAPPDQQSLIALLRKLPGDRKTLFLDSLTEQERALLVYDWRSNARPAQLPPGNDWLTWLIMAGRGFGKTRTGAEFVRDQVEAGRAGRIALIAQDAGDARDVMVEGPSGILAISPKWFRPGYEPSKRRITWPNGAIASTFSDEDFDALRGPEHDLAWVDELAKFKYQRETWDNLMFGLRIGDHPRVCITTTPRPTRLLKEIISDTTTAVTRGSTYHNRDNLAARFFDKVISKYAGTRLGRQEIDAELLDDNPAALWKRGQIEKDRITKERLPQLRRVVVGVDPSVTSSEESSLCGLVVVGMGPAPKGAKDDKRDHGYVLDDRSMQESPDKWARAAVQLYRDHKGDRIIGEVNNGGDLVEMVMRQVDVNIPFRAVRATRGKQVRAEPISALSEQGRWHHVGCFADLEDELCNYDPLTAERSPDRMDAMVWAGTELFGGDDGIEAFIAHMKDQVDSRQGEGTGS